MEEPEILELDQVYISYNIIDIENHFYIDSIKVKWVDTTYVNQIDSIKVYSKEKGRFKSQNLEFSNGYLFVNSNNGMHKPFNWAESNDNNLDSLLKSLRGEVKMNIIKDYFINIYSKRLGKKRVVIKDTSAIILKELYAGSDLVN